MRKAAHISDEDVIIVYTPLLASDAVWEHVYGQDIEYEYRQVPAYLMYLIRKYGIVPHWLLLDTVQENSDVGEDKAAELIDFCIVAGMFSTNIPEGDKRQLFYYFTDEQRSKLLKVRKGEAMAYQLADVQMKDPSNPEAGRTEENAPWYRNAIRRLRTRDERYYSNMRRIDKLKHLVVRVMCVIIAYSWMIELARALTADKGLN